jgi:hypothetical protein
MYLFSPDKNEKIFVVYFLTIFDNRNGINNTVATGIKTSRIEIFVEELINAGSKKGSKNPIVKFVKIIEIAVNSILPFNRFTIIGEATAVGAIAVINTV